MSRAIELVKELVGQLGYYAHPANILDDLDREEWPEGLYGLEEVADQYYTTSRWGDYRMYVLKVVHDNYSEEPTLVGIIYFSASGDGESGGKEEWDYFEVEPKQTTEYVKKKAQVSVN